MATPGTMLLKLRRVTATMPAAPPKAAMSTSHRLGEVRASNSEPGWFRGLSVK